MPVYMISAVGTEMIKIGWTYGDVEARRRALQCSQHEELRVIRVIEGPRESEYWLHDHYADRRLRGEWYRACETMRSIDINEIKPIVCINWQPPPVPSSTRPPPTDAKRLIDALGGAAAIGKATGTTRNTVIYWTLRQRIPVDYWPTLMNIAEAMDLPGIDHNAIAAVCMKRKKRVSRLSEAA